MIKWKDEDIARKSTWLPWDVPIFIQECKTKSHNDILHCQHVERLQNHEPTNKVVVNTDSGYLFNILDGFNPLLDTKAKYFHEFIAKGLYIKKTSMPRYKCIYLIPVNTSKETG